MQNISRSDAWAAMGMRGSPEGGPDQSGYRTPLRLGWARFRRHKPAVASLVVLAIIAVLAVLAPVLTPSDVVPYHPITVADLQHSPNQPPQLTWPPNVWTILGTDGSAYANSVMALIIWGARVSLTVGFVSAFVATAIGVVVGAISGYYSGVVDDAVMRVTDVFLALPFLPVLILGAALFGQGHVSVIVAIFVVFNWPYVARLARASFLSLREQDFTEAARALGVSDRRIIFVHLLPLALRPIVVQTTLSIATFIVLEATLDFLGVGIKPQEAGVVSWGSALSEAQTAISKPYYDWWWVVFPGLALALTVIAVNFIGDGLGDALDVRLKP